MMGTARPHRHRRSLGGACPVRALECGSREQGMLPNLVVDWPPCLDLSVGPVAAGHSLLFEAFSSLGWQP